MQMTQSVEAFLLSLNGVASKATLVWYRRRLNCLVAFLGDVDVQAVTIQDLRRWRVGLCERTTRYADHPSGRSALQGGLSKHTLHGYVRAAKRLFAWLEEENLIAQNTARRLELPKLPKGKPKGIEHTDLAAMLETAAKMGERELALCWFFYSTGARAAGVVGLKLSDLHLESGRAHVTEKGNKTRVVQLIPKAVEALRAYLQVRPDSEDDHVFLGIRGPLKYSGLYQILERIAQAAGVKSGWNPHNWRHRRIRDWQAAGVSLGLVSQAAGHSQESVTADIYGRLPDDELMNVLDQVPLPFSPEDMVAFSIAPS